MESEISRRGFLEWTMAAGVAASLPRFGVAADQSAKEIAKSQKDFPAGQFVDMHTHLGQVWNLNKELTVDGLLHWMDDNSVSQAIVLPLISPESSSYPLTTDFVLEQTKGHRDRLIPFCSIDPRTSYSGVRPPGNKKAPPDQHRGLVEMLKRYIDRGVKGFGEHKPGVKVDDPRNMAIYRACGEVELPVLFHMDNERNIDVPGLPGLEKALKQNPQTKFVGHGPGWWASISGGLKQSDLNGYPQGETKPGGAMDALMEKYPNIYGEMSAGSGAGAIKRDTKFYREFVLRRSDRIMFGTDYLAPGQEVPQFELVKQLNLPPDVQAKVFRDNARKLLGLTPG